MSAYEISPAHWIEFDGTYDYIVLPARVLNSDTVTIVRWLKWVKEPSWWKRLFRAGHWESM